MARRRWGRGGGRRSAGRSVQLAGTQPALRGFGHVEREFDLGGPEGKAEHAEAGEA
jgi:hypothetical protein